MQQPVFLLLTLTTASTAPDDLYHRSIVLRLDRGRMHSGSSLVHNKGEMQSACPLSKQTKEQHRRILSEPAYTKSINRIIQEEGGNRRQTGAGRRRGTGVDAYSRKGQSSLQKHKSVSRSLSSSKKPGVDSRVWVRVCGLFCRTSIG